MLCVMLSVTKTTKTSACVSWIMVDELTRAGVWRDLRFPLPSRQTDGSSILSISVDAAREMANRVRTLREAGWPSERAEESVLARNLESDARR